MSCEGGKEKKSRNFACSLFVWDVWVDKAPRISIIDVIWVLSSDTGTSAETPLGAGARKVLAEKRQISPPSCMNIVAH